MGGDRTVLCGRLFRSFEGLPEGPKCGDHLFVRNVSIVQVVGQSSDQKEKHVRADIYCGSELPDHVGTGRSAKVMLDLVQIRLGNRVTILESDEHSELPLREAECFAPLLDKFAESSHSRRRPCFYLMINWNSIFS